MIFALLVSLLGLFAFVFTENVLCILIFAFGLAVATRDFEDLKQRVDWLEVKLDEKNDGTDNRYSFNNEVEDI